jgi:hypothetical protein
MTRIKRLTGKQRDLPLNAVMLLNLWTGLLLFAALSALVRQ